MATPTQIKRRGRWSLILGSIVAAVAFAAVAYADNITNNLPGSVKVMALNVGGPTGSTQLTVIPQGSDGKPGCNLTGSTTLVVSVNSSDTSVATVSPTSLTFGSCGDVKTLTVTPVSEGSSNVTLSQTSNNTGGSFNLGPAAFRVDVAPPPNTAPNVSVTGVAHGASYAKGSVPLAGCSVEDAEDGNSSFAASLSAITGTYAADGLGSQTATCSYTDAGGLTEIVTATYSIYDPSAPSIGYTLNPATPDGNGGWYRSDVGLSWSVGEPESPNSLAKTGCLDQSVTADQAETTYSCSATSAGGSAGPVDVSIKRDATAPTIAGSASPAANTHGWNNTDVTVAFSCDDNVSGVASCGPNQTLSSEGSDQSVGGNAVDNAGNSAGTTVTGINIDKTAPTADATAAPEPNGAGWNNTDVTVSFSGTDGLSGIDACSAAVVLSNEGTGLSASGTCTDKAGNESTPATAGGIKIDKTAPNVSASTSAVPFTVGGTDWFKDSVTFNWTATDPALADASAGSGVASGPTPLSSTFSTTGMNQGSSSQATDNAGNTGVGHLTGVNVDATAPTLGACPAGGPFVLNSGSQSVGPITAGDVGSGVDSAASTLSGSVDTSSVGEKTVTFTAYDNVGHSTAKACKYYVQYVFAGFFAPIDRPNTMNVSKAGQAIPLKWRLTDAAGNAVTNLASAIVSVTGISCSLGSTDDLVEEVAAGSSGLQNLGDGYYQINWKSPTSYAGSCKSVNLNLGEGAARTGLAFISFKK